MNNIGLKISEIRKRKGLTQEVLSKLAEINLRTLQRIEKNETEPRGYTMARICNILEINIEDILDYGKEGDLKYLQFFHLSVLTFILVPFGNVVLPLVLWLSKRDKIVNLKDQGINLINFQILWALIFYSLLLLFGILKINSIGGADKILYILGLLCLINFIYPILIFVYIGNGKIKTFYPKIIQVIKK